MLPYFADFILPSTKKISTIQVEDSFGRKTSSQTIERYVRALEDAFFLYKASRYDIRGKEQLKSLEKYYVVDMGFRHLLMGNRRSDIGHIFNVVTGKKI